MKIKRKKGLMPLSLHMANNYFQFKQFIIYQDKCTMKVCTDACILGAWAAKAVMHQPVLSNCLDIGAGTGLLSLILIQQLKDAFIDAIEIEENAFVQAGENFKRSLWNNQLKVIHADAKLFSSEKKYNFIISNPPFYEDSLLSPVTDTNLARHHTGLKLNELIIAVKNNLAKDGSFALLLPSHRLDYFEDLAKSHGFFLQEKLLIRPAPMHDFTRGTLLFTGRKGSICARELTIKDSETYSAGFTELLKEFYVAF